MYTTGLSDLNILSADRWRGKETENRRKKERKKEKYRTKYGDRTLANHRLINERQCRRCKSPLAAYILTGLVLWLMRITKRSQFSRMTDVEASCMLFGPVPKAHYKFTTYFHLWHYVTGRRLKVHLLHFTVTNTVIRTLKIYLLSDHTKTLAFTADAWDVTCGG